MMVSGVLSTDPSLLHATTGAHADEPLLAVLAVDPQQHQQQQQQDRHQDPQAVRFPEMAYLILHLGSR